MATAPGYTAQGFNTTFRAMTSDLQQGGALGRFLVRDLGAQRLAIIDDRSAYGQGLADQVEKSARAAGATIGSTEGSLPWPSPCAGGTTKFSKHAPGCPPWRAPKRRDCVGSKRSAPVMGDKSRVLGLDFKL